MFTLFNKGNTNSIHVSEIDDNLQNINLIDIRETYEYSNGSIKTAKNVPMGQLLSNPQKYLEKDQTYHIICQSGGRSSRVVMVLSKAGYDVVNVTGGMGNYFGNNKK